ncbi:MAG TPA: DUF2512 family protein [Bacillota bacterium]|nr:DUF2512 family protein [Bacillota bacterium]
MKALYWLLRFLVPVVVLYVIGYYVSGFSALTFFWLFLLAGLIYVGDWFILKVFGHGHGTLAKWVLDFLISTVVIFTATSAIEGGQVPLGGALLAALIISILHTMIPDVVEKPTHL